MYNTASAQPQQSKWYFGNYAALDFMTNPPTPLPSSAMISSHSSASQADAAGNLLFYTNGITVYNSSHVVMANGTGLLGIGSPFQSCLIVQKPGAANLHYIFTVVGNGWPGGLNYSVVDMSLAAGLGSVTAKNYSLFTAPVDEKITGTLHCNGTDYWIVIHENNSNIFRSYLLTASGVTTVAVVSSVGPGNASFANFMKISPSGNKLAATERKLGNTVHDMSLYDFDNTSGVVSNYQSVYSGFHPVQGNGLDFSPNGSKLYGTDYTFVGNIPGSIHQWDLCAGTPTAVAASHYSVATPPQGMSMQLAINGKIYISQLGNAPFGYNSIGVINNPNSSGAACNYVASGQTL